MFNNDRRFNKLIIRSEFADTPKFDLYANGHSLDGGPGSMRYFDWQTQHMNPLVKDIFEKTGGLLACGIIKF